MSPSYGSAGDNNYAREHQQRSATMRDQMGEAVDAMSEKARDVGARAGNIASDVGNALKERPYTTLAVAAGLAFAVGALWMMQRQQAQSRSPWQDLLSRLPDLPDRDSLIPRRWR